MGRVGDLAASGRERVRRLVRTILVFVVGFGAGAIWMGSRDVDLPSVARVTHGKPAVTDRLGLFSGAVELTNKSSGRARVLVTVRVYDGDRKVADLAGRAELSPHATEEVVVRGKDRYRTFTDTKVLVAPIP